MVSNEVVGGLWLFWVYPGHHPLEEVVSVVLPKAHDAPHAALAHPREVVLKPPPIVGMQELLGGQARRFCIAEAGEKIAGGRLYPVAPNGEKIPQALVRNIMRCLLANTVTLHLPEIWKNENRLRNSGKGYLGPLTFPQS